MVDYVRNANKLFFQFWKPDFVKVGKYTKAMVEMFSERPDFDFKNSMASRFFTPKTIKNPDRCWFQIWKRRRVPNPDYNPEPVEIDIVRGGIQPDKPWPRK